MAFSQGSRSELSYIAETVFGTTPGTPTFIALPYNTHSLDLSKDRVAGNEIRPDRIPRVDRHGNRQASGDIVVDLRNGNFDAFIESAMFSTWDTTPLGDDELKVGTTLKSFSIQDAALDITQYRLFKGMAVSTMAISIAPNQMVTTTFTFMGKDMTIGGTSAATTLTPAADNQPFDSYSGDLSIGTFGGSASPIAIVTGIDFTINNGLSPTFVVGSSSTPQLEYGRCEIEGTFTAYYEDAALINRFLNETETVLEVTIDDPSLSNTYTFLFPKVKINSATVGVDNPQSRIITCSFVALFDEVGGEESNLVIKRPAAA